MATTQPVELSQLATQVFNVVVADPKPNFARYQLVLKALPITDRIEAFKQLREMMEKSFLLESLSTLNTVEEVMEKFKKPGQKINYTQYQLRLQELDNKAAENYRLIVDHMTAAFKLSTFHRLTSADEVTEVLMRARINIKRKAPDNNNYTQIIFVLLEFGKTEPDTYRQLLEMLETDYDLNPTPFFGEFVKLNNNGEV